jgi:molybdopterin-binding protein
LVQGLIADRENDSSRLCRIIASMGLMTVRAAATHMGIGYSTLKQWIYQGKIRTTQTAGGHHRLSETEIDRYLARQRPMHQPKRRTPGPVALIVALSGRNRLRGFVDEVRVDGLMGQVRLRIGDQSLTAVITRDALEELKLKRGEEAVAVIKSTEVMIAREQPETLPKRSRSKRARS